MNESEIDDIKNKFPKICKKNDKQSFLFNEILFMGRRRDFLFTIKNKYKNFVQFSQQESNSMLETIKN
jgi:hypothetical protein